MSDSDYLRELAAYPLTSDMVIDRLKAIASNIELMERECAGLRASLQSAVGVIADWHNMGGADDVWQIYYDHSPEMKPIREALTKVKS